MNTARNDRQRIQTFPWSGRQWALRPKALETARFHVPVRKVYRFTVIVSGVPTRKQIDALVALPGKQTVERNVRPGNGKITFERTHDDPVRAVLSAVDDLDAVGLRALRVIHDDWVTLGGIASRIGRSREAVRLWAIGQIGPGGFPPPLNPNQNTSFYSWVEVSTWLRQRLGMSIPSGAPGLVIADLIIRLRTLDHQAT